MKEKPRKQTRQTKVASPPPVLLDKRNILLYCINERCSDNDYDARKKATLCPGFSKYLGKNHTRMSYEAQLPIWLDLKQRVQSTLTT